MKKFALYGLVMLVVFLLAGSAAFAGTMQKKTVILPAGEIFNGDYTAGGETVMLSGTVNGNAYVAGGSVIVDGTVNGDLFVAGGSVTVLGTVRNDVRAAGGNITLSGTVGGGVIVFGGNIQLTDSGKVGGSVVAGGGTLQILSPLGRGITAGVGQITIGSTVNGNILAGAGQLTFLKDAVVNGNVRYGAENDATVSAGAKITGTVTKKTVPTRPDIANKRPRAAVAGAFAGIWAVFKLIEFLGLLLVGFVVLKFAPKFLRATSDTVLARPWFSLLVGFLTLFLAPFAILALILTLVGIPLAVILVASLVILWPVANITAGYFIGTKALALAKRRERTYGALTLGLVLLNLVRFVPFVGWLAGCAALLMGLGGLLLQKKACLKQMRDKGMI